MSTEPRRIVLTVTDFGRLAVAVVLFLVGLVGMTGLLIYGLVWWLVRSFQ